MASSCLAVSLALPRRNTRNGKQAVAIPPLLSAEVGGRMISGRRADRGCGRAGGTSGGG